MKARPKRKSSGWGDFVFENLTLIFALSILGIAAAIAWELFRNSSFHAMPLDGPF